MTPPQKLNFVLGAIEALKPQLPGMTGQAHAKPLDRILQELEVAGFPMSRAFFRMQVKPAMWDLGIPIAPHKAGMFIVNSSDDLKLAHDWYNQRIAGEIENKRKVAYAFCGNRDAEA